MSAIPRYHVPTTVLATLEERIKLAQLELVCTQPRHLLKSSSYYTEWKIRDLRSNVVIMMASESSDEKNGIAIFIIGGKDREGGGFSLLKKVQTILTDIAIKVDNRENQI